MGTFAEIQCVNNTNVYGENFLTCLENTLWDFPLPKCIRDYNAIEDDTEPFTAIAEKLTMDTTSYSEQSFSTEDDESIEESSISIEMTENSSQHQYDNITSMWPDKEFWLNLKKYYFNGCSNETNTLKSQFCLKKSKNSQIYSDLIGFQYSDEFLDMDKKLLELLKNSTTIISLHRNDINFENILTFILYGKIDNNNLKSNKLLSIPEENVLRLIFCFYIDALMIDVNIVNQSESMLNGITDRIKFHLSKLFILVYRNYLASSLHGIDALFTSTAELFHDNYYHDSTTKLTTEEKLSTTTTLTAITPEILIENCDLLLLQMFPSNSIIKSMTYDNKNLSLDILKIRHESMLVSSDTVVEFGCAKGYVLSGLNYSICDEGVWSNAQFTCECNIN